MPRDYPKRRSENRARSSAQSALPSSASHVKRQSALQYAYRLLSYRDRSEKEMADKLKTRGFDDKEISAAVENLKSYGFLDERKLAASLKRYALENKHLGIRGAKLFLMQRGINRDIIDDTISGTDETESAYRLIEKKLRSMRKTGAKQNQEITDIISAKLYGQLMRRGYSSDTIRKVMRQFKLKEGSE